MEEISNPSETYFSLGAITDQCCIDLGLPIDKFFNKFLSWGCWGYKELKLDTAPQLVTELLTVSDVNTVRLPANAVDFTKIGVPYGQYIKVLSVNEDLSAQERLPNQPQFSASMPPGSLPNGIDLSGYGGLYAFSNYGGRTLWGVCGSLPSRGHYKMVTRENNEKELLLDAGFSATQIYVEYIELGVKPTGATICHPYASEFVRAYEHHQYEKFRPAEMRSEAAITRTGRDLWNSEMVTKARNSKLDKNTLLTIARKNYRLTPMA